MSDWSDFRDGQRSGALAHYRRWAMLRQECPSKQDGCSECLLGEVLWENEQLRRTLDKRGRKSNV